MIEGKGETMKQADDRDEPLCYSFGEAAAKLHCSVSAVRRLAKAGTLKGFSFSGGAILTRVTALSVRQFVESAHTSPCNHGKGKGADAPQANVSGARAIVRHTPPKVGTTATGTA